MTFEWCFLISKSEFQYNFILHCIAAQCFHQFFMVFIYCLISFFSDPASNEHSQLVEIPVERSIFQSNIQKSVPRLLQLKKYVTFKNRKVNTKQHSPKLRYFLGVFQPAGKVKERRLHLVMRIKHSLSTWRRPAEYFDFILARLLIQDF